MNIFVAKINYSSRDEDLRELFEEYGDVDSAKIIIDRDTGRSKGFGFVEMPDDEQANEAIQALNGAELDGSTLVVNKARPRGERGGGGGRRY